MPGARRLQVNDSARVMGVQVGDEPAGGVEDPDARRDGLVLAVDEDVVGAPLDLAVHHYAVNDHERTVVGRLDVRVVARRARVIEHNLIVGRAADHARRLGIELILALATAGVGGS